MMKIINIKLAIFSFLFCMAYTCSSGQAGECLRPLTYNPVLAKQAKKDMAKKINGPATATGPSKPLQLPFFDDFSNNNSPYPNDTLWMDSNVYINNTMAILPPSIGVATFDGLNKYGYPYNITKDSNGITTDILTSRPIDLSNVNPNNSLILRFFIQKGGNGEAPNGDNGSGVADSFLVEFSDTNTVTILDSSHNFVTIHGNIFWVQVWSMYGNDTGSAFQEIDISIPHNADTNYYRPNFQFRFRAAGNPSGNLDIWNLDYVRLDGNAAENEDVAMYFPAKSLLQNYYSMPWDVFSNSDISKVASPNINLYIKNNTSTSQTVFFGCSIINKLNNKLLFNFPTGNAVAQSMYGYQADTTVVGNPNNFYLNIVPDANNDVHLLVKTGILFGSDEHNRNDSSYVTQDFDQYFAYDDGSAEYGYGLRGAPGGVAVQFNDPSQKASQDTIRAIAIHYNSGEDPTNPNINEKYCNIKIWSQINFNGNDRDDNKYVLYEWDGQQPHITDTLNGYTIYYLDSAIAVPSNQTFYVGWTQLTQFFLNVGYDANYNLIDSGRANPNLWYDVAGSWQQSNLPGALMIRAFVSSQKITDYNFGAIKPGNKNSSFEFKLYPNPSSGLFNLQCSNGGAYHLQLYNITGQIVDAQDVNSGSTTLDYSKMANGLYILRIIDAYTGNAMNKRLVISR